MDELKLEYQKIVDSFACFGGYSQATAEQVALACQKLADREPVKFTREELSDKWLNYDGDIEPFLVRIQDEIIAKQKAPRTRKVTVELWVGPDDRVKTVVLGQGCLLNEGPGWKLKHTYTADIEI